MRAVLVSDVGTPNKENGSIDLAHVETVCREIDTALRDKKSAHLGCAALQGDARNERRGGNTPSRMIRTNFKVAEAVKMIRTHLALLTSSLQP